MDDNRDRGHRIRRAMKVRQFTKVQALASELNVSIASVSRWQNSGEISLEHICLLAERLDVSLDWLLLERGTLDFHKGIEFDPAELQHIEGLRAQNKKTRAALLELVRVLKEEADLRQL